MMMSTVATASWRGWSDGGSATVGPRCLVQAHSGPASAATFLAATVAFGGAGYGLW